MKIKGAEAKLEFEPVTLEITFESLQELEVFRGMSNASICTIEENMRQSANVHEDIIDMVSMKLYDWAVEKLSKYD